MTGASIARSAFVLLLSGCQPYGHSAPATARDLGRRARFASWSRGGGDTVRVGWSTGFEGGGYALVARPDSVFGLATTLSDARTQYRDPTAPARCVAGLFTRMNSRDDG